jgi:type I restriction enzyme M protein
VANVDNVGYDATGRVREGNQLYGLAANLKNGGDPQGVPVLRHTLKKRYTLPELASLLAGRLAPATDASGRLADYVEFISTGKTPARSAYGSKGVFLLKVGNLTGAGISWLARDRNTVDASHLKSGNPRWLVQPGDILLTSSAHNPIYIAKKSDIVFRIPPWVDNLVSFVGEVMLLRPKGIDPYILLGFLRLPGTIRQLQSRVRGQTAHLHARDMEDLELPGFVLKPNKAIRELALNLKAEAQNYYRHNEILNQQGQALAKLDALHR